MSNNIYTKKSSPTNIYLLKVNNRNTEKKCKICLKFTIKTPERLSTLFIVIPYFYCPSLLLFLIFIVNTLFIATLFIVLLYFRHISLLFLVFCSWLCTSKCFLGPNLSIYKRWNNILLQLLTGAQKSWWNKNKRLIKKDLLYKVE